MVFSLSNYFNRRKLAGFIPKRYAELLFRGEQFVESPEFNEAQGIIFERMADIGNAAFNRIGVREGGTIIVNQEGRTVRLGASTIWAGNYLHRVADTTLVNVPMTGEVSIGIVVDEVVIDDQSDPQLKGIVPNTASEGEPLAARLRYDARWARAGDGAPFYPIYTIIDGQLPNERAAPSDDFAENLVERHIRETHGSHIVEGFNVSPGGFNPGTKEQTFIIEAGVLRAEGRRVARSVDQRFRRVEDPELVQVNGETHAYPSGGVVTLLNGPIDSVQTVTVVKRATRNITHQVANGTDALPDEPVVTIESVVQGGNTFAQGTSWVRSGNGVSWAPAGAEPNPGTTYTVTYLYTSTVVPQEIGRQTIKLEPAVEGQNVSVFYRYKLPRIDVIAIDLQGSVIYLPGISSKFNPTAPPVPAPLAPLVRVQNLWGVDPILQDVDQRKLTEADVRAFLRDYRKLADLVSIISLERDVQERDPASRKGSFVDNFESDLQRDFGIPQNAAVAGGFVMLPVVGYPRTVDIGRLPITLAYTKEVIQSQTLRTLSRRINEYQNFTPLPTPVEISPAVDRWNENQSTSSSSSSSSFAQEFSYRPDLLGTPAYGTTSFSSSSSSSTSSSSTTENLPFLRQIDITFTVRRMGPGEDLQRVTFDGIDVTSTVTGTRKANAQGVMTGTFRIPAGIRAGTKEVRIQGTASGGQTSFTGQGTLTITHYHTSSHTHTVAVTIDPIAQSFILDETRQITGMRVEFTARGDSKNHVVLEMRDMVGGLPGDLTYAEGSTPGTFVLGDPKVNKPENWTEIDFRFLTTVPASSWRWMALLTDDGNHSVAIAQLGSQSDPNAPVGFDERLQQWVRANPAQGDLADGSNGTSWRLLPDRDLTHQIVAARYTETMRRVNIGSFKLSDVHPDGISDVIVLLIIEAPVRETRVQIEMTLASGEVIRFEPNVPLKLDAYLTETVKIDAVLYGTATLSPIIMPECQIIWGRLQPTANYISEANAIDLTAGNVKLRTVFETLTPGVSRIALDVGGPGAWQEQTPLSTIPLGDGWLEKEHLRQPYSQPESRIQIRLEGSPKNRPAGRMLRQRATEL